MKQILTELDQFCDVLENYGNNRKRRQTPFANTYFPFGVVVSV